MAPAERRLSRPALLFVWPPETLEPHLPFSVYVIYRKSLDRPFGNFQKCWTHSISTAQKMIKACQVLNIPMYVTTQNCNALGKTVEELGLHTYEADNLVTILDKKKFSMYIQGIKEVLPPQSEVIITGIEAHICVTQTTLDLLAGGHKVYVLQDGVSSCNKEEVPIALRRLASEGAVVTTSESMIYEIMGDAGIDQFRQIVGLVKEDKDSTSEVLRTLCKI